MGSEEVRDMTARLSDPIKQLLDGKAFVTVGTVNPDGSPHLSVMWVDRDGNDILLSTLVGRQKERNLRRNPRVSVLTINSDNPYSYAEIRGSVTLTTEGGRELIDKLAQKYTGRPYGMDTADDVRVVVRVTPERVVERV